MDFAWNRSEVLGLARESCAHCHGVGMRHGNEGSTEPCNCVLRKVFTACLRKFRACAEKSNRVPTVRIEHMARGNENRHTWGMKAEEYMADFYLVTRRALSDSEFRLFKFHFLLGASWRLCSKRLGMDRGTFFHEVYRIEQKLGRIYRELEPYALYPLDEYFGGSVLGYREPGRKVVEMNFGPRGGRALRAPVKKAA